MARIHDRTCFAGCLVLLGAALGSTGCQSVGRSYQGLPDDIPRELNKAILPPYTIEPPDILMIDAIHVIPKHPYHLKSFDTVTIQVQGTLPDAPIEGIFPVKPGGIIDLGYAYGSLVVSGMTVKEAEVAIEEHLRQHLREPQVLVSLVDMGAKQQIAGEHLVSPDGTVTLGSYGSVSVVGKIIAEAKQAVEEHLARHLEHPEVSVDVFAYNSKVYYVITQGAGMGDGVYRFPVTGNETVLDAISQINGLEQVSSKKIWIARAGRNSQGRDQILPIDWNAITQNGAIETNYQVLPGDRVFVAEDRLIAFDTQLGKLTAPLERLIGFTVLGTGAVTRLSGDVLRGGGNNRNTF